MGDSEETIRGSTIVSRREAGEMGFKTKRQIKTRQREKEVGGTKRGLTDPAKEALTTIQSDLATKRYHQRVEYSCQEETDFDPAGPWPRQWPRQEPRYRP